jgi:hypothetical protein
VCVRGEEGGGGRRRRSLGEGGDTRDPRALGLEVRPVASGDTLHDPVPLSDFLLAFKMYTLVRRGWVGKAERETPSEEDEPKNA